MTTRRGRVIKNQVNDDTEYRPSIKKASTTKANVIKNRQQRAKAPPPPPPARKRGQYKKSEQQKLKEMVSGTKYKKKTPTKVHQIINRLPMPITSTYDPLMIPDSAFDPLDPLAMIESDPIEPIIKTEVIEDENPPTILDNSDQESKKICEIDVR